MKNLLYKEFKLSMHPLCYAMIAFALIFSIIPIYPAGMGYMFLLASYSMLFLGANKGQQSNDLLYTALLPVRKRDIVKARTLTTTVLALVMLIVCALALPITMNIWDSMISSGEDVLELGLGPQYFLVAQGFSLLCLSISNLIYFCLYYRNGKSIVAPTLLSTIFFVAAVSVFDYVLPFIDGATTLFSGIVPQIIVFVVGITGFFGIQYLAYTLGSKLLEKVDF